MAPTAGTNRRPVSPPSPTRAEEAQEKLTPRCLRGLKGASGDSARRAAAGAAAIETHGDAAPSQARRGWLDLTELEPDTVAGACIAERP